jgi:hypothetical protein
MLDCGGSGETMDVVMFASCGARFLSVVDFPLRLENQFYADDVLASK